MKSLFFAPIIMVFCLTAIQAQETPHFAAPSAEHLWLKRFVGQWETATEIFMEPGNPPVHGKGSEQVKAVGDYWILSAGQGEMLGNTMNYVMSLGFDPIAKKYTGTWIDSMTSHLWHYVGTLDAGGNILTLEAEGPCPKRPGEMTKFKDITEFKDGNHHTFVSMVQESDGQWTKVASGTARRIK